jgi:hypothetical protein
LQARPPAEPARHSPEAQPMADGQGEAAWDTSSQVTIGMLEYRNTGADRIKISYETLKPTIFIQPAQLNQKFV